MAQADPKGLMSIGKVASLNIVRALDLKEDYAPAVEHAIKDEIQAMSSHFTLAFADVQTHYELDVAKIKSTFTYVHDNALTVIGVIVGTLFVGVCIGAAVMYA